MIRIAVLGYGTVGSGVVKVIQTNAKIIAKRAGQEVEVKYVLDLRDFPDDPIQSKVIHDFNVILEDPEVDIVVETMGGTKPAYEFVKKSLLAGKVYVHPIKNWWLLMEQSLCTSQRARR